MPSLNQGHLWGWHLTQTCHLQTGGMKCLIEHVKLLMARGHKVLAVHRSDTADTAMPPWTNVQASVDIVCRLHQRLGDVYSASDIDVVVVGIFHQVLIHPAKYTPLSCI